MMVANLSRNKKSASSLSAVLKKVSGLVVGIACSSGAMGVLMDACIDALVGLSSMDPDLVWLLLADVYFSLCNKTKKKLDDDDDDAELEDEFFLPPLLSSEQDKFLYVQYGGGHHGGFDISLSSVEFVFKKMHSLVFKDQLYIF